VTLPLLLQAEEYAARIQRMAQVSCARIRILRKYALLKKLGLLPYPPKGSR